jgi:hypothetical protein
MLKTAVQLQSSPGVPIPLPDAIRAPVVLFIFNRPETTARVLDSIARVRPPRLLVVADGPRSGNAVDAENCAAARKLIEQKVCWTCDVQRDFSETNLGCARRVASGLNWVFDQVDAAIVLEDDCVADASFFTFCDELLLQYKDDMRVGQIAGANFQDRNVSGACSYYFSRYPHCWGWATWRRAWKHYDFAMESWNDIATRQLVLSQFETGQERDYWRRIFERMANLEIDTWDYQWTWTVWKMGQLTIIPKVNLVENIGFGADATHTKKGQGHPARSLHFPLVHPDSVDRNKLADAYTFTHHFTMPMWKRVLNKLKRVCRL